MTLPYNPEDLYVGGHIGKPHGIAGELTFNSAGYYWPNPDDWIFIKIDGIPVPFKIEKTRRKSADTLLLKLLDVDNEQQAALLKNNAVYVPGSHVNQTEPDEEADGYSAFEFLGFTAMAQDDPVPLGRITHIDDTTANWLFHIETPHGKTLLVPIADDFVTDIDIHNKTITLSLPEGLLDL